MRSCRIMVLLVAMLGAAEVFAGGAFVVHIQMPDGRVVRADQDTASIPRPDSSGFFHFKLNGKLWAIYRSHVWFERK